MEVHSDDLLSSSQECINQDELNSTQPHSNPDLSSLPKQETNVDDLDLLSSEQWNSEDEVNSVQSSNAEPAPSATPAHSISSESDCSKLALTAECLDGGTNHELNPKALETYLYPVNYPLRDYQLNIVRKSLQKNIICALPTGLGKTFIASVVMLNFFRWTKQAKIVFIAPTRPLVAQQVKSFLEISGISVNQTAALLQSVVSRENRAQTWSEKRVFFATAQTVENDLRSGIVDPRSIALLVLDEAHRATGNHSYVNVVNLIRETTRDFRILALTATPSSKLDGVQLVINNLLIAGTEIRSEESLDIREYVHDREIMKLEVAESEEETKLVKLVNMAAYDFANVLKSAHIISTTDLSHVHYFALQQRLKTYMAGPAGQLSGGRKFQIQALSMLVGKLAYALQLLRTHGIMPFYTKMHSLEQELAKSKGKNAIKLASQSAFKECLHHCRSLVYNSDLGPNYAYKLEDRRSTFISHPKIALLVPEIERFLHSQGADSRIIVFAEFRDSAAEIKWALDNSTEKMARSTLFVGQASSGKLVKGMTQKEQQKVLNQFKSGEYNVLIATSIGEEGLDIGQVDLIVCYDQSQSPIRNIQRMGRTGRKRDGRIVMLMTKAESEKLELAFEGHKYIRDQIYDYSGTSSGPAKPAPFALTYFKPNRMIPPQYTPQYTEVTLEPPPENVEALASGDVLQALKPKPKRRQGKAKKAKKVKEVDPTEYAGFTTAQDAFNGN